MTRPSTGILVLVVLPTLREGASDLFGIVQALRGPAGRFRVEIVASAASCGDRIARGDVDVVVLDARLDGACDALLPAVRDRVPLVVVLGSAREAAAFAARGHGAVATVVAGEGFAGALQASVRAAAERAGAVAPEADAAAGDAVFRSLPAAAVLLDGSGRVLAVNDEYVRCFGAAAREAAGLRIEHLLPQDLVESGGPAELLARASGGERFPARLAHTVAPGGRPFAFDLRAARVGGGGRLLLTLTDVSERELLAGHLGELPGLAELVLQTMTSALLVVDGAGLITFANAAAERILRAEGLPGRRLGDWFPATPWEKVPVARAISEGARFRGAEAVITLADGSLVPIGLSCAPLDVAGGRRLGAAAIFQDLSEMKALQRQALQHEKLASIGQLAGGVAHEINNPTGFIHANLLQMSEYLADFRRLWDRALALQAAAASGDAQTACQRATELASLAEEVDAGFVLEDFGKAIRESQEGSERIRHIVQDLREFSRQDTGEPVLTDVNACLDSTASIVWTMMKHQVVLKREYADLPRLRCYPLQLKQVFMNLLLNAYQSITEKVGGRGEVGEIRLSTRLRDGAIVVTVSDTGVGIDPATLGRIFDPFFTTREVGVGTGLGLSTSFGIVQRHGGRIDVRSEPGEGATFEVVLPLDGDVVLDLPS